jgi:hypothetical protein
MESNGNAMQYDLVYSSAMQPYGVRCSVKWCNAVQQVAMCFPEFLHVSKNLYTVVFWLNLKTNVEAEPEE